MNKDFDLDLKMEKNASEDVQPKVKSIVYCTPGCRTGRGCNTGECGLTKNCTNTWLCR